MAIKLTQIDTSSKEGQLLLAALAMLTTGTNSDKTPDEVLEEIEKLSGHMLEPNKI